MIVDRLYEVILARRRQAPADSYVAALFSRGRDAVLKKIGEECCEVILAAKNDARAELVHEIADLAFHLLLLMAEQDLPPDLIRAELERRFGTSGLTEKVSRPAAGVAGKT